jgi:hypothetical protein
MKPMNLYKKIKKEIRDLLWQHYSGITPGRIVFPIKELGDIAIKLDRDGFLCEWKLVVLTNLLKNTGVDIVQFVIIMNEYIHRYLADQGAVYKDDQEEIDEHIAKSLFRIERDGFIIGQSDCRLKFDCLYEIIEEYIDQSFELKKS